MSGAADFKGRLEFIQSRKSSCDHRLDPPWGPGQTSIACGAPQPYRPQFSDEHEGVQGLDLTRPTTRGWGWGSENWRRRLGSASLGNLQDLPASIGWQVINVWRVALHFNSEEVETGGF